MSSTSFDVLRLGLALALGHQEEWPPEQYCMIKTDEEHCNISQKKKDEDPSHHHKPYPSLTLGPLPYDDDDEEVGATKSTSDHSNSYSNSSSVIKRERSDTQEFERDDQVEEKMNPSISRVTVDHDHNGNHSSSIRKKLRLTKDQSALLEDSFKDHSTLNPKQKQDLARKLNLRARQVEVWFQNRRARTKLKKTEVECEVLKKCCENLTEENKRLQKELQELKAMKTSGGGSTAGGALYVQLPVGSLMICPSCATLAEDPLPRLFGQSQRSSSILTSTKLTTLSPNPPQLAS